MPQQYNPQGDIEASRTSRRWAALGIYLVTIFFLGLIWFFVQHYYGDDGVRIAGVVLGIALLILFVIGLGWGVMAIASGLTMRHHNNVLEGLVDFQREDDRGEIARVLAGSASRVLVSDRQVDNRAIGVESKLLTYANQMSNARERHQLEDRQRSQQQQAQQAEQDWYQVPARFEEDTPGREEW